ncbi:sensor histidine kinase [Saccharopolyspora phatthalungensis]|uniref:histidine kinase n=1 Tax=Saccharopolyspora phatthalungensis TaxID=664693 RepID=A0A840Q1F7_9PSEU|nr:sensor histidine kinase [Saccharopolyspora phatthalungensis]MBB5153837.1 signal transduction histidine kinase [Saccharopolyspora phatthalungensis]
MSAAAQETGMLNNDPATGAGAATDPAANRTKKWWLRNWRLRYKMAAVLLVPTLAALAVGGIRVYDGLATQSRLNSIVEQVELGQQVASLTHELQRERDFAVVLTNANGPNGVGDYTAQNQRVDAAVQQLRAFDSRVADFTLEVSSAYQSAMHRLDSLGALRNTINTGFTGPQTLVAYNSVLDSLLQINRTVSTAAVNTQVSQTARAAEALGRAKEQLAQQRSILLMAGLRGQFLTGQTDAVRAANARFEAAFAEFESAATPEQSALYAARVAGPEVDRTEQIEQTALIAADRENPPGIDPLEWGTQSAKRTDLVRSVEDEVLTDFHDDAAALADSATWSLIRDSVLLLLLLVVAFGVAAYIARSMLRPLRTLRYGALEIAQQSLPDAINKVNENPGTAAQITVPPVPVYSNEEIGQVARTFDAVHQQALRLASEQALLRTNVNDLFVNLARRSQTLVQRQLALIDRLERDEQDPDQLSSLFELDHLATRMRRNNENLLILGGTDLTRRMMRPVALNEVLGAAVSEVEQYARVAVVDAPDLAIQGRVVNDFVHLVAELLENATVFSNPDTEVTVRTAYRRQELVIEIRDRGVGIDAGEVDEINERLTRPPEIDVAVSRRMGLFVVGQLARRHNIRVELHNNDGLEGGVTATVRVSGEFVVQLTPDGPMPMPDVPRAAIGEEPRESVSETGTHLGLAAAFGGRAAAGTDRGIEPLPERTPLPSLAGVEQATAFTPKPQDEPDNDDTEVSTQYSVTVTSGDSFGATDVPEWEDASQAPADDEVRAEEWPSEESGGQFPDEFDGQCGGPSDPIGSADLFRSPFEAEKTARFTSAELPVGLDEPVPNGSGPDGTGLGGALFGSADSEGAADNGTRQEPATEAWALGGGPVEGTDGRPPAFADDEPRGTAWDMDDAPTQRLPIYEAVLSQWFRESDVDEFPATPATPARSASADNPEQAETPEPVEPEPENEQPDAPEEHVDEVPRTTVPDPGWGSADVGWKAAEALLQTQQVQETTAAGLPKRVPKTNLVPGSAAPRTPQTPRRKPAATRSADAVRGRMANFQQGVKRGRHSKAEPVSTEPPRSNPSRPEEQE